MKWSHKEFGIGYEGEEVYLVFWSGWSFYHQNIFDGFHQVILPFGTRRSSLHLSSVTLLPNSLGHSGLLKYDLGSVVVVRQRPDQRQNDGLRCNVVRRCQDVFQKRQNVFVEKDFDATVRMKSDITQNGQRSKRKLTLDAVK